MSSVARSEESSVCRRTTPSRVRKTPGRDNCGASRKDWPSSSHAVQTTVLPPVSLEKSRHSLPLVALSPQGRIEKYRAFPIASVTCGDRVTG